MEDVSYEGYGLLGLLVDVVGQVDGFYVQDSGVECYLDCF